MTPAPDLSSRESSDEKVLRIRQSSPAPPVHASPSPAPGSHSSHDCPSPHPRRQRHRLSSIWRRAMVSWRSAWKNQNIQRMAPNIQLPMHPLAKVFSVFPTVVIL